MVNETINGTRTLGHSEDFSEVFSALWLAGIVASWICFFAQIGFFTLLPLCRKYDEKVLSMLTIARIINTMCEYTISNVKLSNVIFKDVVYVVYFQTDFVMVCWMFVFSKNLYDKVVLVFTLRKCNLVSISLLIWFLALPLGLVCPFLLKYNVEYFRKYYKTYAFVKFVIIVINALIFVEIFSVAFKKGCSNKRHFSHLVKAAVISFILVCITSLQVLTTDLLSIFLGSNQYLINSFCVLNSFQVVIISTIFIILAKGKSRDAAFKTNTIRYRVRLDSTTQT